VVWCDGQDDNYEDMAMSVLKRGNSKNWYIQFQFKGKTYVKSSKTTDKRIAERMEREWKVKLHSQLILGDKSFIRYSEITDMYLKSKEHSPNYKTLYSQSRMLNQMFPIGKYLHEISNQDVESFVQKRYRQGVKSSTIVHSFNLIRGVWKYGRKLGYQTADLDFPVLKLPKHRLRYLTIEEEKCLLSELNPKREVRGLALYETRSESISASMQDNYDLVVLLLDTGARYSEIAKIEWSSINLKTKEIRLWRPKVKNESILYMSDRVHRILQRRNEQKTTKYVFNNKKGGPRRHTTIAIRKAFNRVGLTDCTIHTLRHTHATRLIQNGLSIYEVKEILGHTDIATTMRYSHLELRDVSSKARDVINHINSEKDQIRLKIIK